MPANCMTCKHRTHDPERIPVCGLVYNSVACLHCKAIQSPLRYSHRDGGMWCMTCMKVQPHLSRDDWREGYIGKGANGIVTPLPCCPGWEMEVQPEPKRIVVADRQKSLFED